MDRLPVLYVEDNAVNALIMSALFERRPDMRLVLAETVAEALQKARGLYPAVLLLDLRLPDGDGRELLPLLRGIAGCETAPAVAVTAESDVEWAGTGFEELWLKPLDLKNVLQRLDVLADSTRTTTQTTAEAPACPSQGWFPHAPSARPSLAQA